MRNKEVACQILEILCNHMPNLTVNLQNLHISWQHTEHVWNITSTESHKEIGVNHRGGGGAGGRPILDEHTHYQILFSSNLGA